uniref:Leucine-rich repeat-containing G-protein coupled receptor 7 n=1 Tax=Oryctolagus cuniculus TaxID=9986 RepID=G1SEZ2_RABIT
GCWYPVWVAVSSPLPVAVAHGSEQDIMCSLGYFSCGNITKCLPQFLHCNGVDDCGNRADEDNCEDNSGWPLQFDNYFAHRYKMPPAPRLKAKTSECRLVGSVPGQCACQGLHLDYRVIIKNTCLQNNRIRSISTHAFRGLHNLIKLYLSHNRITSLKPGVFEDLRRLEWLIIEDNHINRISPLTFYGLNSLILLVLMDNVITRLPDKPLCQHMPRLHWLDLEGNHIHKLRNLTFMSCTNLTVLIMRRNEINHLNENAFIPLQKLHELDLGSNKLENLPPHVFKDLKELSQLNLSHNPIQEIPANQFDYLVKLKSLSLEGIEIPDIQQRMFRPLMNLSHIYFKKFQYCGYAPHVRSCKPNTDGISSVENLLASILQRVFVWVVSAVTCFGNVFVICMRPYIRSENKLHALSIISLCCADCLMGIYLFVIGAFDLKFRGEYNKHARVWMESIHCQLMGSLAILSTEVSVLLLTFLTLEKYICVVYPFRCLRPQKCRTITALLLIWMTGFLVAFTPLSNKEFFRNFYGTNGVCFPLHSEDAESTGAQIYSVTIFLGVNLAAFLIIVFSYGSMFYSVHQSAITATEIRTQVKREGGPGQALLLLFVFTDALCLDPHFCGTITSWVVIFILPINSALNPILYTLTTRPFKEMIRQFWFDYRQRRSIDSKGSQKTCAPSFIWVEMWPLQEMPPELIKPPVFPDRCEITLISQPPRLNSFT